MAVSPRLIKRRIKSIRSTRKIMKAMELVAASKMRKATQLVLGTRPYAKALEELSHKLQEVTDPSRHPFLAGQGLSSSSATLVVVIASDRGLCGGFNSQVLKKTFEFLRSRTLGDVRVITVGRRAEQAVKRAGYVITAAFESISNAPAFDRSAPVAALIRKEFLSGSVTRVFAVYTDFKSALTQVPMVKQLLPVIPEERLPNRMGGSATEAFDGEPEDVEASSTLWEPSPDAVLAGVLPRALDAGLYQNLLESSASEHAARMMAMKSAGDAAGEMLEDLVFTLNQARQAGITREISEISAGKAAIA